MGGRGKSSGSGSRPSRSASPSNFGDVGIALEELEAAESSFPSWVTGTVAMVAKGVEEVVRGVLTASPEDYAHRHEEMARLVGAAVQGMQRRPAEQRAVFSERLAPLFRQLREQAEGAT